MTGPELTLGQVTTADLYRELVAIRKELSDALIEIKVINVRNAGADQLHHDQETRLRALERFRFTVMGVAVSVSTVVGGGTGVLATILTAHR